MQPQITQQLQRTQQLCANAVNVCQQIAQELQQLTQTVQNSSGIQQQQPQFSYQSQQGGFSSGVSTVMGADRAYSQQENTPSYRNYNAQPPSYSQPQSGNYGSSSNNTAGVQSVMSADRFSNSF